MSNENDPDVRQELLASLIRLSDVKPHWRFGQIIGNLTEIGGYSRPGGHWDISDVELLAACRYLLEEAQ